MPSRKKKHNAVIGVFETRSRAEQAVADLKAAGFTDDDIGMVYRDAEGKTVKTGAAGKTYAEEGAKVVVADLNTKAAERVAKEIGANAAAVTTDVSQKSEFDEMLGVALQKFGRVDIMVNNAGYTHRNGDLTKVDEATFDRVYAINVKSIYYMAHAVVPIMRKQKYGVILNVGSVAGIRPRPGLSWYNSSKGAVNLLSKTMAVELGPDGIRVNAICPVMGATGMLESFMGMPDTPENRKKFTATIPLALSDAVDAKRLKRGDTLLMVSVGAGFTVGALLIKWGLKA